MMKPAVRLAQTWFLVSVVPLCVFIFSRLEIQMKCRSVSAQTHTPPLPPLCSLSTLALILPLVPLSSSLHLWMSGFLFRFASFCRTWREVEEEVGWRHRRVWRTICSLCLGRAEMWRKTMLLVLQMQIRSDFEGLCVSWDRWQDVCALHI